MPSLHELVCINSLADVERIIQSTLEQPEMFGDEGPEVVVEELRDPELDLTCVV